MMMKFKKTEGEILEELDTIDTYQKLIGFYYTNEDLFENDYSIDFKEVNNAHNINEIVESMRMIV